MERSLPIVNRGRDVPARLVPRHTASLTRHNRLSKAFYDLIAGQRHRHIWPVATRCEVGR